MLDTAAPHMAVKADTENRTSSSIVSIWLLSRELVGRMQWSGSMIAIKEEKVNSDYLHTDPVDVHVCAH